MTILSLWQDRLSRELIARQRLPPKLRWQGVLLDMSNVSTIDSTAMQVLAEAVQEFKRAHAAMYFACLSQQVLPMVLRFVGVCVCLSKCGCMRVYASSCVSVSLCVCCVCCVCCIVLCVTVVLCCVCCVLVTRFNCGYTCAP